jgi:hypothetical protein
MKLFRLLAIALPLLLTACGLSEQEKADYAAVQRSGVNPVVYNKMVNGDALSLYDVKALARAGVNDGVVIRYMQNLGTIYVLNSNDVQGLLKAGVPKDVVDYMMSTPHIYAPAVYTSVYWGPYWGPSYYGPYWGPGPWGPPLPYPAPYCYGYRRGCWR